MAALQLRWTKHYVYPFVYSVYIVLYSYTKFHMQWLKISIWVSGLVKSQWRFLYLPPTPKVNSLLDLLLTDPIKFSWNFFKAAINPLIKYVYLGSKTYCTWIYITTIQHCCSFNSSIYSLSSSVLQNCFTRRLLYNVIVKRKEIKSHKYSFRLIQVFKNK